MDMDLDGLEETEADMTISRSLVEDYLALTDDSAVAILPHALRVAVELGVADELAEGPLMVNVLADKVGADPDPLYRLLRALAGAGFFVETHRSDRVFALTELGHRLRERAGDSMHGSLLNTDSYRAWQFGLEAFRGDKGAFAAAHGDRFFAHKDQDPEADQAFLRRMRERASRLYPTFVRSTDWSHTSVVMDIGGADGLLLSEVLSAVPGIGGMLFERPAVADLVRRVGSLDDFGSRLCIRSGDFFEAVPSGADTHLMCSVLHDWTDDEVVQILVNSRDGIAAGGRLLVVEMLVPATVGQWHPSHWSDLGMMVLTGGRERSGAEFELLLREAGYACSGVRNLPGSFFSVIEAVPAACTHPAAG
jgi:hypothetical protein